MCGRYVGWWYRRWRVLITVAMSVAKRSVSIPSQTWTTCCWRHRYDIRLDFDVSNAKGQITSITRSHIYWYCTTPCCYSIIGRTLPLRNQWLNLYVSCMSQALAVMPSPNCTVTCCWWQSSRAPSTPHWQAIKCFIISRLLGKIPVNISCCNTMFYKITRCFIKFLKQEKIVLW